MLRAGKPDEDLNMSPMPVAVKVGLLILYSLLSRNDKELFELAIIYFVYHDYILINVPLFLDLLMAVVFVCVFLFSAGQQLSSRVSHHP